MERITYCPTCDKVFVCATKNPKKRKPLCHSSAAQTIFLCSCGYGLPLGVCGQFGNNMSRHNRTCPPLNGRQYSDTVLRDFIRHVMQSSSTGSGRPDRHDEGPSSKRPRMDEDDSAAGSGSVLITEMESDEEVSVYL